MPRSARCGALALLVGAALAGCGGGGGKAAGAATRRSASQSPPRFTPANNAASADRASLGVGVEATSPPGNALLARYTCRGEDRSPRIFWQSLPGAIKEVVVLVRVLQKTGLQTAWAVAGLSPQRREIREGETPAGAVVGRNSSGQTRYNLCPAKGLPGLAIFTVLGLPFRAKLQPGFPPSALAPILANESLVWGYRNLAIPKE